MIRGRCAKFPVMKLTVQTGFWLSLLILLAIFSACSVIEQEELTVEPVGGVPPLTGQLVDCPDLGHNMQDTCVGDAGWLGIVSDSCVCVPEDTSLIKCLALGLNFGDTCTLADSTLGTIGGDCECSPISVDPPYDCPDWYLNVGDGCNDTIVGHDTIATGRVTENCDCEDVPFTIDFDCPELRATIGDTCYYRRDDGKAYEGRVTDDCKCDPLPDKIEYSCPEWGMNVGDTCMTGSITRDSLLGILSPECECDALPDDDQFDCFAFRVNFGDDCIKQDSLPGTINERCRCE